MFQAIAAIFALLVALGLILSSPIYALAVLITAAVFGGTYAVIRRVLGGT